MSIKGTGPTPSVESFYRTQNAAKAVNLMEVHNEKDHCTYSRNADAAYDVCWLFQEAR
jgi:hypothetical protein